MPNDHSRTRPEALVLPTEKTCPRCGATKPLAGFSVDVSRRDGHNPVCKGCNADYYAAHRERYAARYRADRDRILAAANARNARLRAAAVKVCAGCKGELPSRRHTYCEPCRAAERQRQARVKDRNRKPRADPAARGYGAEHKRARRMWLARVELGGVCCARCGLPIPPGSQWHLGHVDGTDEYAGPEHVACNTATQTKGRVTSQFTKPPHSRAW